MNNEEILVKITEHDNSIAHLKDEVKVIKNQQKQITDLTMSVHDLAVSVQQLVTRQESQELRIRNIEDGPGDNWNAMKKTAFTSIVSTIAGALAVGILMIIVKYI